MSITLVRLRNLQQQALLIMGEAYRQNDNVQEECQTNTQMIKAAVTAVESVSKALACVVLITGTKTYGLQMLDKFPYKDRLPLSESLPRIPAEYAKDVFYYHQVDALTAMSQGKKWTWCEVRPDVIVRFLYQCYFTVNCCIGWSRSDRQCALYGPDHGYLPQPVRLCGGTQRTSTISRNARYIHCPCCRFESRYHCSALHLRFTTSGRDWTERLQCRRYATDLLAGALGHIGQVLWSRRCRAIRGIVTSNRVCKETFKGAGRYVLEV